MKRTWIRSVYAAALAWVLLATLLVGCGGGEDEGEGVAEAPNGLDLPAKAFSDDVTGVVWIDLTKLSPARLQQTAGVVIDALPDTMEPRKNQLRQQLDQSLADYEADYAAMMNAGLEQVLLGVAAADPTEEPQQFIVGRMAETVTVGELEQGLRATLPELPTLEVYEGQWVAPAEGDGRDVMVAPTDGSPVNRDDYQQMLAEGSGAIRIALRVNEAMKQQMQEQAATSPAAALANPIARIETGLIELEVGTAPRLDGRLTFTDAEAAQEFVTAWNGLVVQAQGFVAGQIAEMPEAPAPEQIERTFEPLKMSADGTTARIEVDAAFLERVAQTLGAMGALPLPMGPGGAAPPNGGGMPGMR